ncbi:hypothetical protein [Bacillus sp. SM2101]|uniref:hypothetical protein n=1 Tax=Bacillaceae TaxID=186817 RepID=UPI001BDDE346|nr:hypothetical protein [Bacillus sp. SM2101]
MSGHSSAAGIVLVLFILLVIILIAASGRSRYSGFETNGGMRYGDTIKALFKNYVIFFTSI